MSEHIPLYFIDTAEGAVKTIARTVGNKKFCVETNADLRFNKVAPLHLRSYFWRTDHELFNCLRCLAKLRQLEQGGNNDEIWL